MLIATAAIEPPGKTEPRGEAALGKKHVRGILWKERGRIPDWEVIRNGLNDANDLNDP